MAHVSNVSDQQRLAWLGQTEVAVLLDAAATAGQLTMVESLLQTGDCAPVHVHSREDEAFLMLSGSAVVWSGDDRYELGAGGVAWLPRDVPHTYRITSDDSRMLTMCTPGGLEGFFREAGHDLTLPRPEGWLLTPPSLAAAAAAHGVTILGPPRTD